MSCETCGNPDDGGSGICDQCFDVQINSQTSIEEIVPGTRFSFYPAEDTSTSFWAGVFVLTSKSQKNGSWTIIFDPESSIEANITDISAVVNDEIKFYLIESD
jgi:hypothetical protein